MTLDSLENKIKELRIRYPGPELGKSEVWATHNKESIHIQYVGYDKKHKPNRIHLSE